jgi:hypothetical protein
MLSLGEVEVVAPEHNNSAKSNALTLYAPLYVREAPNGFRYVNGTPADCVHIALTGLLGYRPDLVVSGINNGANMGDDTIYSGTGGAAMEAYLMGVPALAFSQHENGWAHIEDAARPHHEAEQRGCGVVDIARHHRLQRRGAGSHIIGDPGRCRARVADLAQAYRRSTALSFLLRPGPGPPRRVAGSTVGRLRARRNLGDRLDVEGSKRGQHGRLRAGWDERTSGDDGPGSDGA